ncbi:MAG: RDD family protein [Candidatus Heimdallarchaeota archaeon]|nr:MAG: RDD family protein [Candidatus Heimdallarchaeota archaeon]
MNHDNHNENKENILKENTLVNKEFASLKQRIIAALIDLGFFISVFLPVTYLVKGVWIMSPVDHRWAYGLFITDPLCIIFFFLMVIYFILLEGLLGQTIGKFITGIKVIKRDGSKPGIVASCIRNILRVIDSLPTLHIYGIYLILKSPDKTRFGDKKARTIVINKKDTFPVNVT